MNAGDNFQEIQKLKKRISQLEAMVRQLLAESKSENKQVLKG